MSTFQELQSKWKENGLSDMLLKKIQTLLTDDSEEGVKPCVELLHSFGDEGLCYAFRYFHTKILGSSHVESNFCLG